MFMVIFTIYVKLCEMLNKLYQTPMLVTTYYLLYLTALAL